MVAIFKLMVFVLAIPVVLLIRLIRPWFLVRFGVLTSNRIGHFALDTELYLCELHAGINVPKQHYIDLFCHYRPVSNLQLARMWKRVLHVWPTLIIAQILRVNRLFWVDTTHEVGHNTHGDRDVLNLLDRLPPHLAFTDEEFAQGEAGLKEMGIPSGSSFVCLIVRDSAYLDSVFPGVNYAYHNYRDSNIQNYVLAAEELADRGYYVIRMGVTVHKVIKSNHPKVIDYATNGMRSDFMDIFLGANCAFCISVGTGYETIPLIFRKPIAYVNMVPIGYFYTYRAQSLGIFKHHYCLNHNRKMTFSEIIGYGLGFTLSTSDYEAKGVQLIENTPEEILDLVIEMAERISGSWQPKEGDELLQKRFWQIFPTDTKTVDGKSLYGEIRASIGASFLRNNQDWLQ